VSLLLTEAYLMSENARAASRLVHDWLEYPCVACNLHEKAALAHDQLSSNTEAGKVHARIAKEHRSAAQHMSDLEANWKSIWRAK